MGIFMEEIILENVIDRKNVERGYISESEVRAIKVDAMIDTGAWTLVINEDIQRKLGLTFEGDVNSTLADGTKSNYPLTEAVKIQWKDRSTMMQAVVVAGAEEVLLGALPLEAMDLIVDPVHQTLTGAHGDKPEYVIY